MERLFRILKDNPGVNNWFCMDNSTNINIQIADIHQIFYAIVPGKMRSVIIKSCSDR